MILLPSVQNCQKNSLKECVFAYSALKSQCHIVNNTFLKTAFSAILPTEYAKNEMMIAFR